ncbi:heavy metal sensor histidine kinase [Cupriavidus metallidurans]|uniref:heavy metal sensor histidine kinase n=1 Tax=Cupriavidus TaxID=106589 RepID=UPI002580CF70|nr:MULTISPECIES: heavy metal sensor histidine kinase [unclassified Cupriavidus]GMG92869.1 two-component sensor histidine kinase [Cupriavidus sp. TKC]
MRGYSLTTRLTALFSLTSACVLLGLGVLIFTAMDRHFAVEDYALLRDNMRLVEKTIADNTGSTLPTRLADAYQHHSGLLVYTRGANGQVHYATPDFDFAAALKTSNEASRKHVGDDDIFQWTQDGKTYRGMRATVNAAGERTDVLLGMDTEIHEHFVHAFRRSLVSYVALAVLASGIFGWWAARRGLAPLRAMATRAKVVTGDKLHERMPVEAVPEEVANLAANLNAMLERLQDDFRRLSEFSSDLAHELRTPLTNLMTQTQVALSQPRDAEKYREILASNAEELQRLSRMVSDMLYLAKMEHGLDLPHKETISIAQEAGALFEFYEALAEDKQVALRLQGDGIVEGDRLMLRRALSNLLSNALRHTPQAGAVVVEAHAEGASVVVAVENDGPEIPAELLPSLFDRFFRGDKSRRRPESDSVGLGLSITRAIMTAHGGGISVQSANGKTRFVLRFPPRSAEA